MCNAPVMMFAAYCYCDGGENPRRSIVCRLRLEELISYSPGNSRPAVVQLSKQCSTTMMFVSPLSPPSSTAKHRCFFLDDLGQIVVGL